MTGCKYMPLCKVMLNQGALSLSTSLILAILTSGVCTSSRTSSLSYQSISLLIINDLVMSKACAPSHVLIKPGRSLWDRTGRTSCAFLSTEVCVASCTDAFVS